MKQINLSDALQIEGKVIKVELPIEITTFHNGIDSYDILRTEPLVIEAINKKKGEAVIKGKATLIASLSCDRCLKPVETEIVISFEREIVAPELLEEHPDQAEDQEFMDGYNLVPDSLLQEEVMMNWPIKVLCKEDCKGICKVCGHDLNEGDCGCDTFVPDPRMAAIADLFK